LIKEFSDRVQILLARDRSMYLPFAAVRNQELGQFLFATGSPISIIVTQQNSKLEKA
jgi:hypothetical protein